MTYEKIVVTGGTGLLGTHVVKKFSDSAQITTVDIKEPLIEHRGVKNHITLSITDYEAAKNAFMGNDVVIHLACISNDSKTFSIVRRISKGFLSNLAIPDSNLVIRSKSFTI